MATTTSAEFLIDGKSFVTKTDGDTATVIRTSTGAALTQTEIEEAGDYYNSDLKQIEYAKIYDLKFGSDYISKLGASDAWMAKALSSKQYKDAFKKATGQEAVNISSDTTIKSTKLWSPTPINRDANQRSTSRSSGKFIGRYPLNESHRVKFDYLQVSAHKHVANTAFTNEGSTGFADADDRVGASIGRVFLPMQPGLSESTSVDFNQARANPVEAAAFRLAQGAISNPKNEKGLKARAEDFMEKGVGEAQRMLGDITVDDIAGYFAAQAVGNASLFTRGTGKVLNPNLELLFNGPTLRSFNYSYRFTPREAREAREIKRIIKFFKKNMAPIRQKGKLFLKTPNVFKLKYFFKNGRQHPFLNKIKTCALQSFDVQYTPDGSYMTYDDGSMTSYQVSMNFGELNPIYDTDFDDDTNDMGF